LQALIDRFFARQNAEMPYFGVLLNQFQ